MAPGCGGSDGEAGGSRTASSGGVSSDKAVAIKDFAFDPPTITVDKGSSVTWTNRDDAAHSVIDQSSPDRQSESLAKGDDFKATYDDAGTFAYVCGIHQYMKGEVVVTG